MPDYTYTTVAATAATADSGAEDGGFRTRALPEINQAGARIVEFYESADHLVRSVTGFIGPVLESGGAAIMIPAPNHREPIERSLRARGLDLQLATSSGRYTTLAVADTLRRFMIAGHPDGGRFRDVIGPLIERAHDRGAGDVRIYSEMVAHLHGSGNVAATIELGELWRHVRADHGFELLCAYPMRAFARDQSEIVFDQICSQHDAVIPSDPFPLQGTKVEHERAVARLQREVVALRVAVARMRANEQRLDELAHVDELTSLGNRRAFNRHLEREWKLSDRSGRQSALVLVDVDDFKSYNDRHGHPAGDGLLSVVAHALRTSARSTDVLCRIGGDEFAAILVDCSNPDALRFTQRVHDALRLGVETVRPSVSVSMGYASILGSPSAAAAFERADAELYRTKEARPGATPPPSRRARPRVRRT